MDGNSAGFRAEPGLSMAFDGDPVCDKGKSNIEQAPICDLIPGFGFYNNMGDGLAENLVNAFDWTIGFLTRSRN